MFMFLGLTSNFVTSLLIYCSLRFNSFTNALIVFSSDQHFLQFSFIRRFIIISLGFVFFHYKGPSCVKKSIPLR